MPKAPFRKTDLSNKLTDLDLRNNTFYVDQIKPIEFYEACGKDLDKLCESGHVAIDYDFMIKRMVITPVITPIRRTVIGLVEKANPIKDKLNEIWDVVKTTAQNYSTEIAVAGGVVAALTLAALVTASLVNWKIKSDSMVPAWIKGTENTPQTKTSEKQVPQKPQKVVSTKKEAKLKRPYQCSSCTHKVGTKIHPHKHFDEVCDKCGQKSKTVEAVKQEGGKDHGVTRGRRMQNNQRKAQDREDEEFNNQTKREIRNINKIKGAQYQEDMRDDIDENVYNHYNSLRDAYEDQKDKWFERMSHSKNDQSEEFRKWFAEWARKWEEFYAGQNTNGIRLRYNSKLITQAQPSGVCIKSMDVLMDDLERDKNRILAHKQRVEHNRALVEQSKPKKVVSQNQPTKVESLVSKLKDQGYKPCVNGCKTRSGHPFLVKDGNCKRCRNATHDEADYTKTINTNVGSVTITSKHPHVKRMLEKGFKPCPNGCTMKNPNTKRLVKNKCKACGWVKLQVQADSKHPVVPLEKDGSSIVPLYHPRGHSNTKIFGTLAKVKKENGTFWIITDHQFVQGVYVKNNDKVIDLISIKGWEKFGSGNFAYHLLPASALQIDKIEARKIGSIARSGNIAARLVGFCPATGKIVSGHSVASMNADNYIQHSITTQNYSCGSILLNENHEVVGIHVASTGRDTKNGNNNYCFPLKVEG
jgi:hypothetical protein